MVASLNFNSKGTYITLAPAQVTHLLETHRNETTLYSSRSTWLKNNRSLDDKDPNSPFFTILDHIKGISTLIFDQMVQASNQHAYTINFSMNPSCTPKTCLEYKPVIQEVFCKAYNAKIKMNIADSDLSKMYSLGTAIQIKAQWTTPLFLRQMDVQLPLPTPRVFSYFSNQYEQFRKKNIYCDISLTLEPPFSFDQAQDQRAENHFPAHRIILASLPYFHTLFNASLKENATQMIHLHESSLTSTTLNWFLYFVYTGDGSFLTELDTSGIIALAQFAHQIQFEDLFLTCNLYLGHTLKSDFSLLLIFSYALEIDNKALMDTCINQARKKGVTLESNMIQNSSFDELCSYFYCAACLESRALQDQLLEVIQKNTSFDSFIILCRQASIQKKQGKKDLYRICKKFVNKNQEEFKKETHKRLLQEFNTLLRGFSVNYE